MIEAHRIIIPGELQASLEARSQMKRKKPIPIRATLHELHVTS